MSATATMVATVKDKAGKGAARRARDAGQVPAVVYGDNQEPIMIQLDPRDVVKKLRAGGFYATLLDLEVDGKTHRVLPRAVQFHKVKDHPIHVDFMRVGPKTTLTVQVPVNFINDADSPGLKRGAVLNIVRHAVEIKCTEATLPSAFEADLTGLNVNDAVKVSALNVPEGVQLTIKDRDFVIATVTAPSALKRAMAEEAKAGTTAEE